MSKIMDYLVNGGDEADLAKAQVEHVSGYLGLEIKENEKLRAEIERLRAALWPFAMNYQTGAGYCRDDFRRASEAMGELPIADEQLSKETPDAG